MGVENLLRLFSVCVSFLYIANACMMEDVEDWRVTQDLRIIDIETGTFWNKTTTDVTALTSISVGGGVNYANYLDVLWDAASGRFTISTSDGYKQYEENETSQTISFTVFFQCTGGSNSLIFDIAVQDTNNNPPTFMPTDQYEFTVTPPLPPGFQITGCGGDDIIVRDIDLTTSSIDFTIEDNPYFEIEYASRSSTDPKEFLASLKTKDLIRSLPQDLELTISATDVDGTQDPRITRTATIRVKADESFLFPEELVFQQPFYIATYEQDLVVLDAVVSLSQGYDEEVIFSLDGEYSTNFRLVINGNAVSIEVVNALSSEVLRTGRVVLVVKAEREYTSGATATIIVQLPEVLSLAFEQTQYQGRIVDNVLETLQVTLSQGYQDGFNVSLQNEYASYFSTSVQENLITLQMSPLEANIIDGNNFISLLVIASNEYSSVTAVVTLDIVKDDNISPLFENAIYIGEYAQDTGLVVEQIVLGQGYDQNVEFTLSGDHGEYFSINNTGAVITLSSSGVPIEIWDEQQLLLTISASKPRTVTATTTVAIKLPSARELEFTLPIYTGTLQDTTLTLEAVVLSVGYDEDVNFTLSGDYATYFTLLPAQNGVAITLSTELSDDVITENYFLTLSLSASGIHTTTTSTMVLLEIIKQDANTPVFSEKVYVGEYLGPNSIEIGNISLSQGYDNSVTFRLVGEHAQYFQLSNEANNLNLSLVSDVPPDVIFREQVLLFSILAEKPLTVGANAAVSIAFPRDLTETTVMRFAQNTYIGSIEYNHLIVETIVLETGYDNGTVFSLIGDYESYFSIQSSGNIINLTMQNPLPQEILENNAFIILEIEANRERAVSIPASILVSINKEEIVPPAFSSAYYKSILADGILETVTILLSEGYDDTVTFELQGDNSVWFSIANVGNNVQLTLNTSMGNIPDEILVNNDYFLFSIIAYKPNATIARAAIFVHLPEETPEAVLLKFSQASYVGRIENATLYAPEILLTGEREPISFNITGEYSQFFEVTQITPTNVQIQLKDGSLPVNIDELPFIILDIEAHYPEAISGQTTVVLEVVAESEIVTPVFEQAYYTGVYSRQEGLTFEQSIRLLQGFDETVVFTLAGDDAQWFELRDTAENYLTLILNNDELGQITDRSHLVFSVVASKINSVAGNAAVIINLSDFTTTTSMMFAQDSYQGSIQNNTLNFNSIIMEAGYSPDLNISLTGDHAEYFELINQEGVFNLQLLRQLPDNIINSNNVLVFTIEAKNGNSRTHTTIVLEIIKAEVTRLSFEEAYYVGSYSLIAGFTFDPQITLSEGYDETVLFSLEGEDSQWFKITENQHPVSLAQTNQIPHEVISDRKQLIFVILAEKSGNMTSRSTVIISIVDDTTVLEFENNVYLGTIQENNVTAFIDNIILIEGYSANVSFNLFGDLEQYFIVTQEEASVTVSLQTSIPIEFVPSNGVILLELEASAPQAISTSTTLVFGIVRDLSVSLQFNEAYYSGSYSETEGLEFLSNISVAVGYDENVVFNLEGGDSQYFEIVVLENSVSLGLVSSIPAEIIMNQRPLIFTIRADRAGTDSARATIVITLNNESGTPTILRFSQTSYAGTVEDTTITLDTIILNEGYNQNVSFSLQGDLESYFTVSNAEATVTILLSSSIPEDQLPLNGIIILELQASAPNAVSASTAIVFTLVREDTDSERLVFSKNYYTGHYTEIEGLVFNDNIELTAEYNETVQFILEGENSQYFEVEMIQENSVTLYLVAPIPSAVVMNNHHLIFTIRAEKPETLTGTATIIIALLDEYTEKLQILSFERITYVGSIKNNTLNLEEILLSNGSSGTVSFRIFGDLESYFGIESNGSVVEITLRNPIPDQSLPENGIIILEIEASATDFMSAHAAIVISVVQEENSISLQQLAFSEVYYTGNYTEAAGLWFTDEITLSEGFGTNVTFSLEGDDAQYFEVVVLSENSISLKLVSSIPSAVVMNNHHFIFTIIAHKPNSINARATIVIALYDGFNQTTSILGFSRISYVGLIEEGVAYIDPIVVTEGYSSDVNLTLHGDLQNYFGLLKNEASIIVSLMSPIPEEIVPTNRIIVLEIQASAPNSISAYATIVFELVRDDVDEMTFNEPFYIGQYDVTGGGLTFNTIIFLSEGYDDTVQFSLDGDDAEWFQLSMSGNSVSIVLTTTIPEDVLQSKRKLIFFIVAQKPGTSTRATIIISLVNDAIGSESSFGNILYKGIVQSGEVYHEAITLSGYNGTDVQLLGENGALFSATHSEGVVIIQGRGTVTLSPDVTYVALQLQAGAANSVLLLDVEQSENPDLPSVSFSSSSYVLHTDVTHTGIIGQVFATADNDEAVVYSLAIDNAHLQQRVSVSQDGALVSWASIDSGVYNFDVIATTVFSKVSASVPVHLTVEAVVIIEDNNYVLPPLQILNRDEGSPHRDLVPLNASSFEGCTFSLSNRWPADQNWLYVDESGLHTTAIDREHESIAFMALSQIQVEIVLQCDGDNDLTRTRRSVNLEMTKQQEQLGPYDYGNSRWILTDFINYNPRRSLVNLIVIDVNDNAPAFIGKENEPIVVGYPLADLEERILPKALIQVKATDADVGENAAVVYWSTAEALAVSPTTGSVHVRDIAGLENDMTFTIQATDRNGHEQGLTGSLDILVKLIDTSHIAVVTIQDAFLDDEQDILTNLSAAVGYEIKSLRSTMISDNEYDGDHSRKKRNVVISSGASMQLFVYGLIEREPVNVERLTGDINTSVIETLIVASTVSLEDHLEICPLLGRDTALFVSTIVLAVLLFIVIVAAAVWFFLKWRKENYEQFTDVNSLASQDVPVSPINVVKPEVPTPRMNIEDLKKSERRLQEMLETSPPLENVPAPSIVPSTLERPNESKVNISEPPLVFQSFHKLKKADDTDDEDEFGEIKKNRRKSVVTFNENVEKIIHVEDTPDDDLDIEVYRL